MNRIKIEPCPKTPNCVSSVDTDRRHFVAPLTYSGAIKDEKKRLIDILSGLQRLRIVNVTYDFVKVEFKSAFFGFVDDVEFYFDDRKKTIHVKSASRVGFSDMGVNRRRIEKIRERFVRKQK